MGSNWPTVKLGDHIETVLGKMLDQKKNQGTEEPYIGNSNVRWGEFDLTNLSLMKFQADEDQRYSVEVGDLVVCEGGEPGRCAIWIGPPAKIKFQKALHRIRAKKTFNNYFLYYWFLHAGKQGTLEKYFTGTTIKHLTGQALKSIEIVCPDISHQNKVVTLLKPIDEKISILKKTNQTLEEMAQAIFKSWFVDFDPVKAKAHVIVQGGSEQDANLAAMEVISGKTRDQLAALEKTHPEHYTQLHTTATLFPSAFVNSELGEIPEGWGVNRLGELTSYLNRGISPKYTEEKGILVINQKCIRDFKVDFSKARLHDSNLKKVDGRLLESGDVLVNSTGVGTLGRVAQIEISTEEAIVDSHVTVVRANELISPEYLGQLMIFLQPVIQEMGEGTTGQTELSRAKLAELRCLTPAKEVLSNFSNFISPVRSRISRNQKESTTLANTRDLLLPKLLSGEIDVSQLNLEA